MKKDNRLSWDEFFSLLAVFYSSRGSCDRLRVACILVKDKRIVGAGYNGSVGGLDHCDDEGHLIVDNHCVRTLHSEVNALHNAMGDITGATAYITATPCIDCTKHLLQRGVKRIAYAGGYKNSKGQEHIQKMCVDKGVVLEQLYSNSEELKTILAKATERLKGPGGIFKGLTDV